ncbi:Bacterial cell division membrane protein [uncultured Desulfobacterium sp.]|uniref:Bacterial cell division membrane protein n=1 Tax=uncultured Desulfobacterium sp. TaxID=201089 RepID=A0A445MUC8_9BACT|nr:Bacterial cell division membrane protein [uncultured Desulfobacterium sp.]
MAGKKYGIVDTWKYRRPERRLFLLTSLAIAVGYALVTVRKGGISSFNLHDAMPLAVYLCGILTVHLVLILFKFRGDPLLLSAVLFLCGIGMLARFRLGATEQIVIRNLSSLALPLGLALMLLVILLFRKGRYRMLESLAVPCVISAIALMAAIILWGERYRGALFFTGYTNPSELVKILLIIFLSGFLVRWRKELQDTSVGLPRLTSRAVILLLISWGLPMALLLFQRDLGLIVMLNAVLIVLIFMATGRPSYLVVGLLFGVVFCIAAYAFTAHGQARFVTWLNPFSDATGKGWQILQAQSAMYSGGLWGVGLGAGAPEYIPIASSDLVYAVIGEEIGYTGCGVVVAFFVALFFRGYRIASQIGHPFGRLLAAGIVSTLTFQTLLNIGGVTKALPLTGTTLPFISHGGSSLMTTFLSVGLLMALSEKEPAPDRGKTGKAKT